MRCVTGSFNISDSSSEVGVVGHAGVQDLQNDGGIISSFMDLYKAFGEYSVNGNTPNTSVTRVYWLVILDNSVVFRITSVFSESVAKWGKNDTTLFHWQVYSTQPNKKHLLVRAVHGSKSASQLTQLAEDMEKREKSKKEWS